MLGGFLDERRNSWGCEKFDKLEGWVHGLFDNRNVFVSKLQKKDEIREKKVLAIKSLLKKLIEIWPFDFERLALIFAITNSGQCSHFRPSYLFARRRNSPFRPKWEEKWPFPDDISATYLSVVRPGRWCSVQTSIKRTGACSITLGKIHGPNCWRAWSLPPVQDAILEPGCLLNFHFTPFSNDLHVFYFDWSKVKQCCQVSNFCVFNIVYQS